MLGRHSGSSGLNSRHLLARRASRRHEAVPGEQNLTSLAWSRYKEESLENTDEYLDRGTRACGDTDRAGASTFLASPGSYPPPDYDEVLEHLEEPCCFCRGASEEPRWRSRAENQIQRCQCAGEVRNRNDADAATSNISLSRISQGSSGTNPCLLSDERGPFVICGFNFVQEKLDDNLRQVEAVIVVRQWKELNTKLAGTTPRSPGISDEVQTNSA